MSVGDAHVFPGYLTPVLKQMSFQSHRLLFSHASAEVRGESTPERNFASTGSRTHNHQVMSPTPSPLSHPGRAVCRRNVLDAQRLFLLFLVIIHNALYLSVKVIILIFILPFSNMYLLCEE